MDLTMWEFLQGLVMLTLMGVCLFLLAGAVVGIEAWFKIGINIFKIKSKIKGGKDVWDLYWSAIGEALWKKLQK